MATYGHGREQSLSKGANHRERTSRASHVEDYLDEITSPLLMLAVRSDQGTGHTVRAVPPTPYRSTVPESAKECLTQHPDFDDASAVCFAEPTDTVRGTAGSDTTDSAVSSMSSSYHDSQADRSEYFDTAIVRGLAAWTEGGSFPSSFLPLYNVLWVTIPETCLII